MGDVRDFRNFMGAVIDRPAFDPEQAATSTTARPTPASSSAARPTTRRGGSCRPTVVETPDPGFDLMRREMFGPVVTAYVYDEKRVDDTLDLVDATSPYALTGAVFAHRPARRSSRRRARFATRPATST